MSIWNKLLGKNSPESKASGTQPKSDSKDRQLEIGIQALRKSVVQAEVCCKDKADLEALVADEGALVYQLSSAVRRGELSKDYFAGAMAAYKRGDYKIEKIDGGFRLVFIGMP